MEEIKFIDFRIVKFKDWLIEHKNCNKETIIGSGNCNDSFRFIVCRDCNEAYFVGKIEGSKL